MDGLSIGLVVAGKTYAEGKSCFNAALMSLLL